MYIDFNMVYDAERSDECTYWFNNDIFFMHVYTFSDRMSKIIVLPEIVIK